jgi:hypothetical protein
MVGSAISGDLTLTGPSGAIDLGAAGFYQQNIIYAQAGTPVGQAPMGQVAAATWPVGVNATSTSVLISAYVNNSNFSFATGNYTLTAVLKKDGAPVTLGSGVALASATMEYKTTGNAMASLESGSTFNSGFVCVDMAQIAANDVLTVEKVENGVAATNNAGTNDWYAGGSTMTSIAYSNPLTVTSAHMSAGALAVKARVQSFTASNGTQVTMGINIKKANGTDVSISCGPTAAPSAAPTVAVTGSSATLTPAAAAPAGYSWVCALVNSSNVVTSTGTSSGPTCSVNATASGTYTAKLGYTVYGVASANYSPASASFALTYTAPPGPCNVAATSIHATVATLDTTNSFTLYFNNDPLITNCYANMVTGGGQRLLLNGTVIGTPSYQGNAGYSANATPRTLATLLLNPALASRTINNGDVYTVQYFQGLSVAPTANDTPYMQWSITLNPNSGNVQNNVQNNNVSAPTLPTTVPLVAPISVPVGGVVLGGALKIDGRNMSSVTSVKIGTVAATTTATIAGLEIKVPTDLAPGAHDLLVTTSTGSTLFVGAIKVADPLIVAAKAIQAKAAASIAYRAPLNLTIGSSVTAAQTKATKALAVQYKGAKNALCIAVPASKSTVASAVAAATKVCATIKTAIPGIKTSVIVSAPSGAKSNRVESEIQG